MAGQAFTPVRVADLTLRLIQEGIRAVFDQLEDFRRGLLVGDVISLTGKATLGEALIVRYLGGANQIALSPANLRGNGRGMIIFVLNLGSGTATLVPSGHDKFSGTAAVTTNSVAVLCSDGVDHWVRN